MNGVLVLAGTPIGSHTDAPASLVTAIEAADVIAAEDTRVFAALARRIGANVTAKVVSYFDGNEARRAAELVSLVRDGKRVLVLSDAGMPTVSDPGYRVVVACVEAGLPVTAVPGPSAVTTALAVSGLASDRFCFEGFLPSKSGQRQARLAELATEPRTMVFFEAPHRLAAFLTDAAAAFGADRPGVVCRELSKPHEEIRRGGLAELAAWAADGVRGEVSVVVAGAPSLRDDLGDALALVRERIAAGIRLSSAVSEVAEITGVARRALYEAALADRKDRP